MANVDFQNIADLKREDVDNRVRSYFENRAPGYNSFSDNVPSKELTDKGYRIAMWVTRPGGHTAFLPSASDFNAAVSPQTQSMYIFPTHYALPMVFQGNVVRGLMRDQKDNIGGQGLNSTLQLYADTATKRIEMMFYGDGTGALAYSSSTIGSTGPATLNCTTAAAATPGQTKGARRLENNGAVYNAINTSTGAVRGSFTVTTMGASSCTINVIAGTISSGDPIVDANSYNRWFRGLGWIVSDQNRTLQGLSTSSYPDLNAPVVDLAGAVLTPAAFENIKATLRTRNNEAVAADDMSCYITPGQMSVLKKQGYSLGWYDRGGEGGDTVKGVAKNYSDGDTRFIEAADNDEDRAYLVKNDCVGRWEEMPFGEYNFDQQTWRMVLGSNQTGSDNYQRAIGMCAQIGIYLPRGTAFIKRASLSGVVTQVTSGPI
jgi:hypothetical protein